MHYQCGEMEHTIEESGGAGKAMLRYDAEEVKLLSEGQDVLMGMVEDKIRLQSRATESTLNRSSEEMKELEEKKSKEALLLVQKKKHILNDIKVRGVERECCKQIKSFESDKKWSGRHRCSEKALSFWQFASVVIQ